MPGYNCEVCVRAFFLGLSLLIFFTNAMLADEDPYALPAVGEDRDGMDGKSAHDFFAARREQKECRAKMDQYYAVHAKDSARLEEVVASVRKAAQSRSPEKRAYTREERNAVSDAHDRMRRTSDQLIALISSCGDCFARPVVKTDVIGVDHNEFLYRADGSCLFTAKDDKEGADAFHAAIEQLKYPYRYPHKNGGFWNIIDLKVVDPATYKLLPKFEDPSLSLSDPQEGYAIWLRGPDFAGFVNSYWYLTVNEFTGPKALGEEEEDFHFVFRTPELVHERGEMPEAAYEAATAFVAPTVSDISPLGERKMTLANQLQRVVGSWYIKRVKNEIYFRYVTAADMQLKQKFLEDQGRDILLETLHEMIEKVKTALRRLTGALPKDARP